LDDEIDDLLDEEILATHYRGCCGTTFVLATPLNATEWRHLLASDTEATHFMTKAKHRRDGFKIFGELLYKDNKLFVPQAKRDQILAASHSSEVSNHGGIKATLERLDAFWWPSLRLDMTKLVETCIICQRRKTPRQAPSGVMRSFLATEALEMVSIDCLELSDSMNHRKYACIAVDVFTRFVIGKALKNQQASTFVKFLTQTVGVFGVPRVIWADNAPFFCNEQTDALAERLKFMHETGTRGHHQCGRGAYDTASARRTCHAMQ